MDEILVLSVQVLSRPEQGRVGRDAEPRIDLDTPNIGLSDIFGDEFYPAKTIGRKMRDLLVLVFSVKAFDVELNAIVGKCFFDPTVNAVMVSGS